MYTTSFINADNPLVIIKVLRKEYSFFKPTNTGKLIGKLYRTNESNWYNMQGNTPTNPLLRTMIKMAIDESEKINMVINKKTL